MRPLFQSSLDRRSKAAGRWTAAGVLMMGLHVGGGAAGYVYWGQRPNEIILPPPTVIAFELAPVPVAPPPPQRIEEIPEIEPVVEPPPPISELDLIPPAPPEVKVAVAAPEKPKPVKKKKKKVPEKKKKPIEKKPETDLPPNDFKNTQEAPSPTKVETPPQPAQTAAPVAAGPTPADLARVANAKNMWLLAFEKHIKKYRKYPKAAKRKNQVGTPNVTFVIDRQGNLVGARVSRGSGVETLDEEAVAMFQRATPLPPVPAEMEGATLQFTMPIVFNLK